MDGRDGSVTTRMRTMLLLNSIPVSHIQTHLKPPTCCVFVHVTSDKYSTDIDSEIDNGTDTEYVESFMLNFVSLLCRYVD
jgi:hypothetical protein